MKKKINILILVFSLVLTLVPKVRLFANQEIYFAFLGSQTVIYSPNKLVYEVEVNGNLEQVQDTGRGYYYLEGTHEISEVSFMDGTSRPAKKLTDVEEITFDTSNYYEHKLNIPNNDFIVKKAGVPIIKNGEVQYQYQYSHNQHVVQKSYNYTNLPTNLLEQDFTIKVGDQLPHSVDLIGNSSEEKQFSVTLNSSLTLESAQFEANGQVISQNQDIPIELNGQTGVIKIVAFKDINGQRFTAQIPYTYNKKKPIAQLEVKNHLLSARITKNEFLLPGKLLKYVTFVDGNEIEIGSVSLTNLRDTINLKNKFNEIFETRLKSDANKLYPISLKVELDGEDVIIGETNYEYVSKLDVFGSTSTSTNKALIDSDNEAYIILKNVPKYNTLNVKVDGVELDLANENIVVQYSATEENFSSTKDDSAFTQNVRIKVPFSYIKEKIYSNKDMKDLSVDVKIVDKGNFIYDVRLNPISIDLREIDVEEQLDMTNGAVNGNYLIYLLKSDKDTIKFNIEASEEIEKIELIKINGTSLDSSKFRQSITGSSATIEAVLQNMNLLDEVVVSFGYKIIFKSGKVKEISGKELFNKSTKLVFVDRELNFKYPIIKQARENGNYEVILDNNKTIYSQSNKNITIEASLEKGYMSIPVLKKDNAPKDSSLYLNQLKQSKDTNPYITGDFHTEWSYEYLLNTDASGSYSLDYDFIRLQNTFVFKIQIDDVMPIVRLNESNLSKLGDQYYVDQSNASQDVTLTINENFELDSNLSSITVNGNPISVENNKPLNLNINESGKHVVKVIVYDKAGNKVEKEYVIVKDTKDPNGKIEYENANHYFEDKAYFNTGDIKFKFSENDPFSTEVLKTIKYTIINEQNQVLKEDTLAYPGDLSVSLSNYLDGLYTISAEFTDISNNKQKISSQFVVDTILPQLVKTEDVKISGTGRQSHAKVGDIVQFTFTTNERSIVKLEVEGKVYEKATENNIVTFDHILVQSGVNSVIDYNVILRDNATNQAEFSKKTVTIKDEQKAEIQLEVTKQGSENNVFVRGGDSVIIKLSANENVENIKNQDKVFVDILNYDRLVTTIELSKERQYTSQYSVADLQDGTITFKVKTMDYAGNITEVENNNIIFDKTSPTGNIVIANERLNQVYNHDVALTLTINELNTKSKTALFEIYHEGQLIRKGQFPNLSVNDVLYDSVSSEGKYRVVVRATDASLNSFETSKKFEIDKTKPNIRGLYNGSDIINGKYYNVVATPNFRLDNTKDRIVSVTLNGNDVTNQISASSQETTYKYVVVAIDEALNQSEYTIEYTVDITSPRLIINYLLTGVFYKEKPTPTVSYSDINLLNETFSATLDGVPYQFGTPIGNGNHTLIAQVKDRAENTTVVEMNFGVSENGLSIVIPNAINKKFLTGKVNIKLSDFIQSSIDYDIINATLNGESFSNDFEIEKDGKYIIYFEVKDKAGNIEKKTIEFIVDNTKPNIIFDNIKENEKFTDTRKVRVYLANNQDEITKVLLNGLEVENLERVSKSEVLVEIKENKEYKLEVFAKDSAGNESSAYIEFIKVGGFCWICLILIIIAILTIYYIYKKRKEKQEEKA